MRVVHLARQPERSRVVPLCGAWGSLDSEWSLDAAETTCAACRDALRTARATAARPGARDGREP